MQYWEIKNAEKKEKNEITRVSFPEKNVPEQRAEATSPCI